VVAGHSASIFILASAALVACRQPAATADLCFATLVGRGQNLQTLYCGRDSCYLMVYATKIPRPAAVALFGSPVPRDTLVLGDSLVQSFLKEDTPAMSHRVDMTFSVERNGVGISMPRHPETEDRISELKSWVDNRKEAVRLRPPLWRDSLVLNKGINDPPEVEIRFASGLSGNPSLFGTIQSLRLFQFLSNKGGKERVEWPQDSLAPLLMGRVLKYRVPSEVDSLIAVLKVGTGNSPLLVPNACLDGVFELRTEPIRFR
jgi:hypothetical protein